MKKSLRKETDSGTVIALSVSPDEEDHLALRRVFHTAKWVLHHAVGLVSARFLLYRHQVGVVLCARDVMQGTWIDMVEQLTEMPDAPPLIVTSRLADESLWAEALNLGAYDVLAKPFDRQELVRTVELAWLHWRRRNDVPAGAGMKVMAAGG